MAKAKTVPAGQNSDNTAEILFFVNRRAYLAALANKKAADQKLKQVGKVIKADLGEFGLDQIKDYEKAQTPEGLANIKARREAEAQTLKFLGVPVGTQMDLLEDRAPLVERAYRDGREAGLRGDTLANPYNEASEEGREYARGWHDGQGDLFAGIKQKEEAAHAELIKGDTDAGDDPFGDADEAPQEAA